MELSRRILPEGEVGRTKRARASRPKVKSGCITCKTRRVKCDETKPSCVRCQKFGRECDGYPDPSQGRGAAIVPIQPRIPSVSIYGPSISIHASEEEDRYFQTFINRSANELSGYFDPSFWTKLVLQESHAVPPIRHAVIALGALNKSLESAPRPNLKVNIIQSIDKKHHEYAVLHYLKSIQALNNYINASDSPQLRTTLVACLLFVCFETFQGCYASSVQQTYGGLKILRSYYQGHSGSKPRIPRRPVAEGPRAATAGRTSQALQNRTGCDMVSQTRDIAMHTDEYLETELLRAGSEGNIADVSPTFVYDPNAEYRHQPRTMTGTNFKKEQRTAGMAIPSRKRSIYSTGTADSQSISMTGRQEHSHIMHSKTPSTPEIFRKSSAASYTTPSIESSAQKASSTFSSSSVSTPTTYTPPSTGPHSPSPSQPPPSKALSTSLKRSLASRSPTPPPLNHDFAIEEVLVQTFVRLDGQGLFFGMIPGIPPLIWDVQQVWHIPIPTSFKDFASAQRCWDFLMDRAMQFFRHISFNRAYAPSNLDPPEKIDQELASYLNQLSAFSAAFKPLLDSATSQDGITVLNSAALLLSVYQNITVIMLASVSSDSEMVYDAFLSDFKYIVRICALIITTQISQYPRFTFEVGIIPPLHVVATKCRNPFVRREAIELLFSSPRQEGLWDGVLSARIGKWMTSCEEDGLTIPSLNGSRYSSTSSSSSARGYKEDESHFTYPSPPPVDFVPSTGGWEYGKRISDVVNEAVGTFALSEISGNNLANTSRVSTRSTSTNYMAKKGVNGVVKDKAMEVGEGWVVPEENRVRLAVVDFHIPERHIKVKCRKALPGPDGTWEERETVIAW